MIATTVQTQRIPALARAEAMQLAKTEYDRMADLLRSLDPKDCERPTDCTRWTVQDVVAHLVGMADAMASLRTVMRPQKAGKAIAKEEVITDFEGFTEHQVRSNVGLGPEGLTNALPL